MIFLNYSIVQSKGSSIERFRDQNSAVSYMIEGYRGRGREGMHESLKEVGVW